jgi:hypothetical protein
LFACVVVCLCCCWQGLLLVCVAVCVCCCWHGFVFACVVVCVCVDMMKKEQWGEAGEKKDRGGEKKRY